jgi:uncharacterized membrane protein SpoIIM required for sporulation
VVPHGVLELPAIFIAGGAGFEIARGMLFPGLLPRRESLARAGGRAAQLLLGTIPMLIVAGVIEGFLSPSETAAPLKLLFGAVMWPGEWSISWERKSESRTNPRILRFH